MYGSSCLIASACGGGFRGGGKSASSLCHTCFMVGVSERLSDISSALRMKGKQYHTVFHVFNPFYKHRSHHFDFIRFDKHA